LVPLPQAEQAEHRHEGEVVAVGGLAGGGEQGLELQVGEPEGRRLWRNRGQADVLGRGLVHDTVDDAGAVEACSDRERRDTVEGLNRQASCIHRMYSSRCGRRAVSGSSPRSAHQVR
jgi:hypothetical protein